MVNEINKPTTTTIENEALRVRMENANRNVQSMQQEHDELLREMETLRQRAAELSLLRQTQENLDNTSISTNNEIQIVTNQYNDSESTNSEDLNAETAEQLQVQDEPTNLTSSASESNTKPTPEMIETEEDPENAEYIRQKIEEIAALKAQFKRVQHMVNTSNLIEEHLSRAVPLQEEVMLHPTADNVELANTTENAITESDIDVPAQSYERLTNTTTTVSDDTQEKEELLRAMLNMFNDFTTDLRDQATTLRAERDRLRALRDEILSRRRQQS